MWREQKRSRSDIKCERCGGDPPVFYDGIGPGIPACYICRDCMRIKNVVQRKKVDALTYERAYHETKECACCGLPFSSLKEKMADVSPGGLLRGVVCDRCSRVLSASKSNYELLKTIAYYLECR